MGVLPKGITLSRSGLISGTPKQGGTFTFVIKCLDVTHNHKTQAVQELTLMIDPSLPSRNRGVSQRIRSVEFGLRALVLGSAPTGGSRKYLERTGSLNVMGREIDTVAGRPTTRVPSF